MGVYKLSTAGGLATPRTNYSSFLAGNPAVEFGSYHSIATTTVGSGGSATVTFSSIPSTYTHLQIRAFQKTSSAGDLNFTLNSDTGANYSRHYLYGTGSGSPSSGGNTAQTLGYVGYNPSAVYFQASIIDILDYKSTTKTKTIRSLVGADANGSGYILFTSTGWFATPTAITSISFSHGGGNFSEFSQFALYGIKGA